MKRITKILALAALLFNFIYTPSYAIELDRIIATVNEEAITNIMFSFAFQEYKTQNVNNVNDEQLKAIVAKQLLDSALLLSEARILNIKVTAEEIAAETKNFKEQNKFDDKAFESYLKNSNFTYTEYSLYVADQLKRQKLIQQSVNQKIIPSDENLRSFYERTSRRTGEVYEGSNLMIKLKPDASPEEVAAAEGRLEKYNKDYNEGKIPLGDLIEVFQTTQDYYYNKFNLEYSDLLDEFQNAVKELPQDKLSEPFRTNIGVHLVIIKSRKEVEPAPFDQVKEDVRSNFYRSEFKVIYDQYINSLLKKSAIMYNDPGFAQAITNYYQQIAISK